MVQTHMFSLQQRASPTGIVQQRCDHRTNGDQKGVAHFIGKMQSWFDVAWNGFGDGPNSRSGALAKAIGG